MKSLFKILIVVFLFNTLATNAQVGLNLNHLPDLSLSSTDFHDGAFVYKIGASSTYYNQDFILKNNSSMLFPKLYAYNDLAFFCKVEVKLEKAVKFPVKFRLGDVNYVDQLEGKGDFK